MNPLPFSTSSTAPTPSPPTYGVRGKYRPIAATMVVVAVFLAASVNCAWADDFDEDIDEAASTLAAVSELSDRSRANELLMKYGDTRSDVLNELLDLLESEERSNDRSDWNSEVSEGSAALARFANDLPDAAEDQFRSFVERETKLWTHFREAPGYLFSRFQLVDIAAKIAGERKRLDEGWAKIDREDRVYDDAIDAAQTKGKEQLRESIVTLVKFGANLLENAAGIEGAETAAECLDHANKHVVTSLELLKKETVVWKSFVELREHARQFHEKINDDLIERAMEYAEGLEISGDSEDYDAFKERALRILEEHYDRAEQEYDEFVSENKGKFIEALDTDWYLLLIDAEEVKGWQEYFQLVESELKGLLEKHEDRIDNLPDGDVRRKLKEQFDRMTGSSRQIMVSWGLGKKIYDESERDMNR